MSNTLLLCPFCGGEAEEAQCTANRLFNPTAYHYIKCKSCAAMCRAELVPKHAVAAWNRRAQPENKPLTLDELRQMDGEPVYIAEEKLWAINKCEQTGRWAGMPFAVGQTHGINFEWNIKKRGLKCYRYKPERSEG